jgi:putative DNA primase/helicase
VASSLDSVVAQMRAMGMPDISPSELVLDSGQWERYGKGKRAYYRIERRVSRAGREYYVGAFGHKGNGPHTIAYEGAQLTAAEAQKLEADRVEAAKREAVRRAREVQRAADRAAETWREATVTGASPYLERKRVPLSGGWVRYRGQNVVVPMVRFDLPAGERLKGVQIISPNGKKLFTSGMNKPGSAAVLGHHQVRQPILIAEGLATAASCWFALERRHRVVVAFDTNNLAPVARIVRDLHPDARLLFCADDDHLTDGNPGRNKAREIAGELGRAGVVFPIFRDRGDRKLTDFNDLHCEEGLDEVATQLNCALKWLPKV